MSGLELVGVALGVPTVVDLCIKCGQSLLRVYQSFKNAREELLGLFLRVQAHWTNLEFEIEFFAKVQDCVEDHIQLHFRKLVNTLYGKLQLIALQIEDISSRQNNIFKKPKVAFLVKNSLAEAITEFTEWHNLLQPLFFLLTRISDPRIDQKISENESSNKAISAVKNLRQAFRATVAGAGAPIILTPDERFKFDRQLIQYTSIEIKRISENERDVLIDTVPCEGNGPVVHILRDVRDLAKVLREVEPMTFGIPACAGLVKVKDDGKLSKLEMVFDVPPRLENPRSLRSLLLNLDLTNGLHPINARIQLAKRLARTVLFVHSANFVHKNFRPETIIVFDRQDESENQHEVREIGIPFLVGFQKIRLASGPSAYMGDTAWEQNIYRHPKRQGQYPEQAYQMQHDIYSLGVCLLEIALWKSFVLYDAPGKCPIMSQEVEMIHRECKTAFEVKDMLVAMSREHIPQRLGSRYAEVTISCLTCLDENDTLDEQGISVGVSYIEKILGKLEEISV